MTKIGSCVGYEPLDRYVGRHLDRCVDRDIGQYVDQHISIDTSAESRSMCRPTYRSSISRYVDRYVGRDVDRHIGRGVRKLHMIPKIIKNVHYKNYNSNNYYYYMANPVPVLSLVLSQSGFCSTDCFHGNGPILVFLFWSKAGKFNICNQDSEKKKCENCHSSH